MTHPAAYEPSFGAAANVAATSSLLVSPALDQLEPWPHEQSHLTVEVDGPGCVEHGSFIALRAPDGSYLRVPDGESAIADFRADRAERRTRFRIERIGHSEGLVGPIDDVALAAPGGSYLRVRYRDPKPDRPLRAEASSISPWERFVIRARQ